MGLSTVEGVRSNAASWNGPWNHSFKGAKLASMEDVRMHTTIEPLTIQPSDPPALALSSEYSCGYGMKLFDKMEGETIHELQR